jgi:hypothetical protein
MLSGYKTYIIAAFVVAGTLAEVVLGIDIPGFEPADNWLEYIIAALGLGTLRAGVSAATA